MKKNETKFQPKRESIFRAISGMPKERTSGGGISTAIDNLQKRLGQIIVLGILLAIGLYFYEYIVVFIHWYAFGLADLITSPIASLSILDILSILFRIGLAGLLVVIIHMLKEGLSDEKET